MKHPPTCYRLLTLALGLLFALLAHHASAQFYTWDPQGTTGGNPYTGSLSGFWETNGWSTSETGQATPVAWVEGDAAVFAVHSGANTPAFIVTMSKSHTVAGIFNGPFTTAPCPVTIQAGFTLNFQGIPIPGGIILPAGLQQFDVTSVNGDPGTLTLNVPLSDGGGANAAALVCEGNGTIVLNGFNGTNTYSAGTYLGDAGTAFTGTLAFTNGSPFGTGGIAISNTSTTNATLLFIAGGAVTITNSVTNSSGTAAVNIIGNPTGLTFSGPWSLNANANIGIGGGNNYLVNISGPINGPGNLQVFNSGILELTGNNTFTGNIITGNGAPSGGTLLIGGAGQLGYGVHGGSYHGMIYLTNSETLVYSSTAGQALYGAISGPGALSQTIGRLNLYGINTFTGNISLTSCLFYVSGSGQLGSGAYAGSISLANGALFQYESSASQTLSGIISGAGTVTVASGSLNLTAANTYTGATTLNGGTLLVSGGGGLSGTTITTTPLTTLGLGGSSGYINGPTVLDPGSYLTTADGAIDTMTFGYNLSLPNANYMDINAATGSADQIIMANGSTVTLNGSLTVSNLSATGTLADGQSFKLFQGTIAGTFTNLYLPTLPSGLFWGTEQLAVGGNGTIYVTNNDPTACCPTNNNAVSKGCVPSLWTQLTNAPVTNWSAIASSYDGTHLVATVSGTAVISGAYAGVPGGIYTSANSGETWTLTSAPITNWVSVASSGNGSNLVAAVGLDTGTFTITGGIYTSANNGVSWVKTSAPDEIWCAVASSEDGSHLVAVVGSQEYDSGGIYTSADSGMTWTQTSAPREIWNGVTSSADGSHLAAASGQTVVSGQIYTSTNSGETWIQTSAPDGLCLTIAGSADGSHLYASADQDGENLLYISANAGQTWVSTAMPGLDAQVQSALACSSDGSYLVATIGGGGIYISTNFGVTWSQTSALSANWNGVAMSADGNQMFAVVIGGGIWSAYCSVPAQSAQCVDPNYGQKYVQEPNLIGGDAIRNNQVVLADDFVATNSGPVLGIHLWNSWQGDFALTNQITFWLGIYDNVPANGSNPFSHPGTNLLWQQTFGPGQYAENLWGSGTEAFYDPVSLTNSFTSNVWYYCFYPSEPFVRVASPANSTTYWLAAYAQLPSGESTYESGWTTASNVLNGVSVVANWPGSMPTNNPGWTTNALRADLSFMLNTDTNCCPVAITNLDDRYVMISWNCGVLQSSPIVAGPYTNLPASVRSPYTTLAISNIFYRTLCN